MQKTNFRIWILFLLITFAFTTIIGRLFYLQVIRHDFFEKKSKQQHQRIITINPNRGNIVDRKGQILATTLPGYSIYLDTFQIKNMSETVARLTQALGPLSPHLFERQTHFVWVKRKVAPEIKEQLKGVPGVYFMEDTKRLYPFGHSGGQIMGFVNVDDEGLSGIEYAFNQELNGKAGKIIIETDPTGEPIFSFNQHGKNAKTGKTVKLTIDHVVQSIAEINLQTMVDKVQADSGLAIVMDLKDGSILGMANYPYFDPNNYSQYRSADIFQNKGVSMVFEPGSVMKLFTVAAAIEEKQIKLTDRIYVPSQLVVQGTIIEEAHNEGSGNRSVLEILAKSLNVGAAKIGLMLGPQKLHHYLSLLEFGKRTGLGIGGESSGILWPSKLWRQVDLSRIAFGYSVSVTPIQLLKAVSAFGNDGVLVDPYIVDDGTNHQKHRSRVFSPQTVKVMKEAMINIVENGTGEQTRITGFSVGGKTGTARRFVQEANGYVFGSYNNSFLGLFPVSEPRFAMIVIITNPRTTIFASQTAVPCFKGIAQQLLRYYRIKPDALPTQDAKVRT